MRIVKLPVHDIRVAFPSSVESSGSICCSGLYEFCPKCGQQSCVWSCDGAHIGEVETKEQVSGRVAYNGAVDGIMSMILAHAISGIDVESPAYLEGIETALQAAGENI